MSAGRSQIARPVAPWTKLVTFMLKSKYTGKLSGQQTKSEGTYPQELERDGMGDPERESLTVALADAGATFTDERLILVFFRHHASVLSESVLSCLAY